MRKIPIIALVLLLPPYTYGALLYEYDFENWGGSIATTPSYWSGSGYASNCTLHEDASEVVTGYDGLTPYDGNYFFIVANSAYQLDPTVPGISAPAINPQTQIGLGSSSVCANTALWDMPDNPNIIYAEMWFAGGGWEYTVNNSWFKLLAVYDIDFVSYPILGVNDNYPDPPELQISAGSHFSTGVTASDLFDGNWHKIAIRVNYNTRVVDGWYDVANPTDANITLTNAEEIQSIIDDGGGEIRITIGRQTSINVGDTITITGTTNYNGTYTIVTDYGLTSFGITAPYAGDESGTVVIGNILDPPNVVKPIENWAAHNPTGPTWGAVDNFKIYDSLPSGVSTITCYPDVDNDRYPGSESETVETCSTNYYEASHFIALTIDCDDTDAAFNPGATQVCGNGLDEQTCEVIDDTCPTVSSGTVLTSGGVPLIAPETGYVLTTGE